MTTVLARSVPAVSWLRADDRSWLRPDIIAAVELAFAAFLRRESDLPGRPSKPAPPRPG